MAKVRALSTATRPARPGATTVEGTDAGLMAALAGALAVPTPSTYRTVAAEYWRLKVFDRAHHYLERALTMDPRDPATHDALARLWRDAGLPHVALGDAYRGVFFSGGSPATINTLGTVLQALGRHDAARAQYTKAARLDPSAAYAWSNLCYAWLLEGRTREADAACRRALVEDPGLSAARNNLGLVYALTSDIEGARRTFEESGDRAAALFNMGIVHLARHRYVEAAASFRAAYAARPSLNLAWARAAQATRAAQGRLE